MLIKSIGFILGVLAVTALACGLSVGGPVGDGQERDADEAAALPESADGRALFQSMGCSGCHNSSGQPAPSLEGLFGAEVTLADGSTVTADDAYLRRSITDPGAQLVQGYEAIMPDYSAQLSQAQVDALVAYIRSLGD